MTTTDLTGTVRGISGNGTRGSYFAKPQGAPAGSVQLDTDSATLLRESTAADRATAGIALYDYNGDRYTPDGLIDEMVRRGELSPAARDMIVEDALDQHANACAIDRDGNFDQADFPKLVLDTDVTITDHPLLELEYWHFPDYDSEPRTSEDALHEWIATLDATLGDFEGRDEVLDGTVWDAPGVDNIQQVKENVARLGLDFDEMNCPLPVRENFFD